MFLGEETLLVFMLVIMAVVFAMFMMRNIRRKRLRKMGIPAVADVIDVKIERILRSDAADLDWSDAADRFVNERKYTYMFYYTVDGIAYTRELVREDRSQVYGQGESVDIYYNPENPKEMMTAAEVTASTKLSSSIILIFAVVFAVVLFFLFRG